MRMTKRKLKATQVMTPPHIANAMLDLLDPAGFADATTVFFEPSCGDGQIVECLVERIFTARLNACPGDMAMALVDALSKVYAIDLDPEMVVKAQHRIYAWADQKVGVLTRLESYLLARLLHRTIEEKDFFDLVDKQAPGGLRQVVASPSTGRTGETVAINYEHRSQKRGGYSSEEQE
ncbi:MAG: hypothetical protein H8K07_01560 [Nitrospira sp.]|nr:hypothetical protein [Nitrospira sp.]